MSFSDLGLSPETLKAIDELGYDKPTPIQEQAIPQVLMGRDVLGIAQTGTGKTAGFTLPMIDILANGRAKARMPRSLILAPTRELANQVAQNFVNYGKYHKLSMALLIGGESFSEQEKALDRGVDVLIATPGRLMDLFGRGRILLRDVKILVIDEADRMLDMGFIPDVEKIVSLLPPLRQTLFFSATMDKQIRKLADAFLQNPKEVRVAPGDSTAKTVTQRMIVVADHDKREALRHILHLEQVKNAFIFCNRKRDVSVLHRSLQKHGFDVVQLHGDMPQSERTATLARFKAGDVSLMVCSDVAARGIDIADVSHVFNFDVPSHSEDYVHRIGRTGRAGREGRAYTIATPEDIKYVAAIEALIGNAIPRIDLEGIATLELTEEAAKDARRGRRSAPSSDRSSGDRSSGDRSSGDRSGGRGDRGGRSRHERSDRTDHTPASVPVAEAAAPVEDIPPMEAAIPTEVTAPAEVAAPMAAPVTEAAPAAPVERPRRDRDRDNRRSDRQSYDRQSNERSSNERSSGERQSRDRQRGRRDHPAWEVEEMPLGDNVLAFGGHTPAFLLVDPGKLPILQDDDYYDEIEDDDDVEMEAAAEPAAPAAEQVVVATAPDEAATQPARAKRSRRRRSRSSNAAPQTEGVVDDATAEQTGTDEAVSEDAPTVEALASDVQTGEADVAAQAEKPKRASRSRRKPAAAKTEAVAEATPVVAEADADAPAEAESPKPKRAPRARKAAAKTDDTATTEEAAPAKPKRVRKTAAKADAPAADAATTEDSPAAKPKRVRKTAAKADDATAETPAKKPARRRTAKAKTDDAAAPESE